jgi:hypothetical protein
MKQPIRSNYFPNRKFDNNNSFKMANSTNVGIGKGPCINVWTKCCRIDGRRIFDAPELWESAVVERVEHPTTTLKKIARGGIESLTPRQRRMYDKREAQNALAGTHYMQVTMGVSHDERQGYVFDVDCDKLSEDIRPTRFEAESELRSLGLKFFSNTLNPQTGNFQLAVILDEPVPTQQMTKIIHRLSAMYPFADRAFTNYFAKSPYCELLDGIVYGERMTWDELVGVLENYEKNLKTSRDFDPDRDEEIQRLNGLLPAAPPAPDSPPSGTPVYGRTYGRKKTKDFSRNCDCHKVGCGVGMRTSDKNEIFYAMRKHADSLPALDHPVTDAELWCTVRSILNTKAAGRLYAPTWSEESRQKALEHRIENAEVKKVCIAYCRKNDMTQKETAVRMGYSLRTVKGYWNATGLVMTDTDYMMFFQETVRLTDPEREIKTLVEDLYELEEAEKSLLEKDQPVKELPSLSLPMYNRCTFSESENPETKTATPSTSIEPIRGPPKRPASIDEYRTSL